MLWRKFWRCGVQHSAFLAAPSNHIALCASGFSGIFPVLRHYPTAALQKLLYPDTEKEEFQLHFLRIPRYFARRVRGYWKVRLTAPDDLDRNPTAEMINIEYLFPDFSMACTRSLEQDRGLAKAAGPTVCRSGCRRSGSAPILSEPMPPRRQA